ncbi:MAG: hypothetical protein RSB11_06865 [Oscillospiraceae bacterium]
MADKDVFSEFLIDEILNDAKRYSGEDTETKKWSLGEIDKLIADDEKAMGVDEVLPKAKPPATPVKKDDNNKEKNSVLSLKEIIMNNSVADTPFELSDDNEDEISDDAKDEPQVEIPGQITIEKTRIFNEVEARAVHSDKIKHNISANKVINTNEEPAKKPVMETDKYRERFLNKPKLNLEKTMEHKEILNKLPPKTIERPGIIVKNISNEKTGDDGLSPVPIIVAVDDELNSINQNETDGSINVPLSIDDMQIKDQIMLDGFEKEESPHKVDEYETEMDLIKKRREKAKEFKLFPNLPAEQDEDDEYEDDSLEQSQNIADDKTLTNIDIPEISDDEKPKKKKNRREKSAKKAPIRIDREYFGPRDAQAVYDILESDRKKSLAKVIVTAGYMIVLAVCASFVSLTGNFLLFGDSEFFYIGCSLVLLLATVLVNMSNFKEGMITLFKGECGVKSAADVAIFAAAIQCIVAFFNPQLVEIKCHLYASVAMLPMLLLNIGEYIKTKNDISSFELLFKKSNTLHTVASIDDENDAFEIGRGLLLSDPDIRYGTKVGFLSKFVEMTKLSEPADKFSKIMLMVAVGAGAVLGVATAIITKDVFVAVTAATGAILLGIPSLCILSTASILKNANKSLSSDGAFVSGYAAVEDVVASNAVCVDASDIFHFGGSNIYGIKTFHSMKIDDAILYTAAVIIESKGALSDVFDGVILSRRDLLPNVESLAYEEKLGCSGWIFNHRVLVGSRDLLSKHNVEVPPIEEENKFKVGDRQLIYLAVEGKIAAMFVVGYNVNINTAEYMKKLEKHGISILVRTSDPNITEELIENYFDLPRSFVKIISPVAGEIFKEKYNKELPKSPCLIAHSGGIVSFFKAFSSVFVIEDQ